MKLRYLSVVNTLTVLDIDNHSSMISAMPAAGVPFPVRGSTVFTLLMGLTLYERISALSPVLIGRFSTE